MLYPADPPTVEEIVCVMRHAREDPHGFRLRAMIVMLWRGGLRVQEALVLSEHDFDQQRGSVLVRRGKGGRRREVGLDPMGLGEPEGPALSAPRAPPRPSRDRRPNTRSTLVSRRSAHRVSPSCLRGRRKEALRTHQLRHVHAVSSPARAFRSTLSSARSAIQTSALRASTWRALISRRSSPPCMPAERR